MVNIADILLKSFLLFGACQVLHIILWRIKKPKIYPLWLFSVFIILPLSLFFLFCIIKTVLTGSLGFGFNSWIILFSIFLCHAGLSGIYAHYFPIIIIYSPSLEILKIINSKMPAGTSYDDIHKSFFNNQKILEPRLNNLLKSGVILKKDGIIYLSEKGEKIAKLGLLYRKIVGLPPGKG